MPDARKADVRERAQLFFGKLDRALEHVQQAIGKTRDYLFSIQHEDGYWCGELEADTTLESDYILLHTVLGTMDPVRQQKCCREILRHQNEDGGWPISYGGPSNISASVKAYFALKLSGLKASDPVMVRARHQILSLGGVVNCNTFTKIYLCFVGQYSYDAVPAVPPEMVLFPNWFWFNIYEISSWSRAILIPLSLIYAKKPFKKIPDEMNIDELFVGGRENAKLHLPWSDAPFSWRNFFLVLNHMTHWFERVHIRPLRSLAIKRAEKWMLERFEMSDGLGAIYPAMMNSILAMRCLGYSLDDPQMIRAIDEFEKLGIEEEETFRMQPCMSPVWDTAYASFALGEAGVPATHPRLVAAGEWMLKKQVTHKGDWAEKVKNVQPGGWYFEFNNEFYPDVDDTAMVMLAFSKIETRDQRFQRETIERAMNWLLAMQCKAGGWASFDRDNTKMVFQNIPFADHNAMLDPPTVDITGRILEMLATYGYSSSHPVVKRAIDFIRKEQEPDGSWFGRWGVNYIYGTMLCMRGLQAMDVDINEPVMQQASEWLRMVQNADGGWGESCNSYDQPATRGVGPSTPSQTAWAILGLLSAGDLRSESVHNGIQYLLRTQRPDGNWDEPPYTGTGFPRVFYLAYHLYRCYFPLMALTTYAKAIAAEPSARD